MKKFLVLYKASHTGFQAMMNATDEHKAAVLAGWKSWGEKAKGSIVDMGGPLGQAVKVNKAGKVDASPNDLGGYGILQGESKEAVAASLKEHPHFMLQDSWIEIVELVNIPGM